MSEGETRGPLLSIEEVKVHFPVRSGRVAIESCRESEAGGRP